MRFEDVKTILVFDIPKNAVLRVRGRVLGGFDLEKGFAVDADAGARRVRVRMPAPGSWRSTSGLSGSARPRPLTRSLRTTGLAGAPGRAAPSGGGARRRPLRKGRGPRARALLGRRGGIRLERGDLVCGRKRASLTLTEPLRQDGALLQSIDVHHRRTGGPAGDPAGADGVSPVSSTAHLALAQSLIPGFAQPGILFDVLLHVGTLGAVVVFFRERLTKTATGLVARDPAEKRAAWKLVGLLLLAVAMTGLVAMPLKKLAVEAMTDFRLIGASLCGTALLLSVAQVVGRRRGGGAKPCRNPAWRRRAHRPLPGLLGDLPRPFAFGKHDLGRPFRRPLASGRRGVLVPPLDPDDPGRRSGRESRRPPPRRRSPRRVGLAGLPRRNDGGGHRRILRRRGAPPPRHRHAARPLHRVHRGPRPLPPRPERLSVAPSPRPEELSVLEKRRDEFLGILVFAAGAILLAALVSYHRRTVALLVRPRPDAPPEELGGSVRRVVLGRRPPVLRRRGLRPAADAPRPRRAPRPLREDGRLGDEGTGPPPHPPDDGAARASGLRAAAPPRRRPRCGRVRRRRPRLSPRLRPERPGAAILLASGFLIACCSPPPSPSGRRRRARRLRASGWWRGFLLERRRAKEQAQKEQLRREVGEHPRAGERGGGTPPEKAAAEREAEVVTSRRSPPYA